MTRAHLILELARVCETTHKEAKEILEVVLDGMVRALRRGESVELRGFGVFRTRKRRPRTGRNPLTGARVQVPAKRVPFFKPGRELKEMLLQLARPVYGSTDGTSAGASNDGTGLLGRGEDLPAANAFRSGRRNV